MLWCVGQLWLGAVSIWVYEQVFCGLCPSDWEVCVWRKCMHVCGMFSVFCVVMFGEGL